MTVFFCPSIGASGIGKRYIRKALSSKSHSTTRRNGLAKQEKPEKRTAARKVKDKWKAKQDYKVLAPDMFGGKEIAETISGDPESLKGRILEVSLIDLTGDISKMHIKVSFKIEKIRGNEALTILMGHDLTSDYIRRLTRRRHSKMDSVCDIVTKDGYHVRVKPMAITEKRIQTTQEKAIRHKTQEAVEEVGAQSTLSEFMKIIINGELQKRIFWRCKPIYPIKRVEIRRSQVMGREEGAVDILPEVPGEGEPVADGKPQAEVAEGAGDGDGEAKGPTDDDAVEADAEKTPVPVPEAGKEMDE